MAFEGRARVGSTTERDEHTGKTNVSVSRLIDRV